MKDCRLPIADCELPVEPRHSRRWFFQIGNRKSEIGNGFTLIELLVVISILGLLAALTVPALKNFGRSDARLSATQQMLGAVGRARQLAIADHTTVYMVFVPPNFFDMVNVYGHKVMADLNNPTYIPSAADRQVALNTATNLITKQLSGYNFISYGQVGDQPGRHAWHYLADWKALPEGTFIASAKFQPANNFVPILIQPWQPNWSPPPPDYAGLIDGYWRFHSTVPQIYAFTNALVPFPTEKSPEVLMPCITFNSFGRLVSEYDGGDPNNPGSYHHAYIPLEHGTVGYGRDLNKQPQPTTVKPSDIIENPPGNATDISYNVIDIDPLTGRATLLYHKVQ